MFTLLPNNIIQYGPLRLKLTPGVVLIKDWKFTGDYVVEIGSVSRHKDGKDNLIIERCVYTRRDYVICA